VHKTYVITAVPVFRDLLPTLSRISSVQVHLQSQKVVALGPWSNFGAAAIRQQDMSLRVLGSENPIPPRDRESPVNAVNKAEFIELASQGQAPTQTHRSDWADKTPSLFREDLI
jgi:hypothetical protein